MYQCLGRDFPTTILMDPDTHIKDLFRDFPTKILMDPYPHINSWLGIFLPKS
jgi:hypothetical protein